MDVKYHRVDMASNDDDCEVGVSVGRGDSRSSSRAAAAVGQPGKLSIAIVLFVAALYVCNSSIKGTITYPFLRTLVTTCAEGAAPMPTNMTALAALKATGNWSGSQHCSDLQYVAGQAQVFKNTASSVSIASQLLVMPSLGSLSDSHGRRPLLIVGAAGVCATVLMDLGASLGSNNDMAEGGTFAFFCLGSFFQGATGIFLSTILAMVVDITPGGPGGADGAVENRNLVNGGAAGGRVGGGRVPVGGGGGGGMSRPGRFAVLQIAKAFAAVIGVGLATVFVVRLDLDDYSMVWVASLVLSAIVLLVTAFCIPESLPASKRTRWRPCAVNPISTVRRLGPSKGDSRLFVIAVTVFVLSLSLSVLSLIQGFAISEYEWTQFATTVLFVGIGALGLVGLGIAPCLVRRYGPDRVLGSTIFLLTASLVVLCFSLLSAFFFVVGLVLLALCSYGVPAYLEFVSVVVGEGETGEILASLAAVALTGYVVQCK